MLNDNLFHFCASELSYIYMCVCVCASYVLVFDTALCVFHAVWRLDCCTAVVVVKCPLIVGMLLLLLIYCIYIYIYI